MTSNYSSSSSVTPDSLPTENPILGNSYNVFYCFLLFCFLVLIFIFVIIVMCYRPNTNFVFNNSIKVSTA